MMNKLNNKSKYLILPSLETPKYILPLSPKKGFMQSLTLYTPFLFKRKLQFNALKITNSIGFLKYLLADLTISKSQLLQFIPNVNEIIDYLHKNLDKNKTYLAFYIGKKGKVTIQVMNEYSIIIGYLKVAKSEDAKKKVYNEFKILSFLSKYEFDNVSIPQITSFEEHNNKKYLLTSSPPKFLNKPTIKLTRNYVEGLVELFKKSFNIKKFYESECYEILFRRLKELKDYGLNDEYTKLIYKKIKKNINKGIPLGLCHYDFKPWNIKILNNKIYVFDWELAKMNWLPLWDIFHFILQPSILVRKMHTKKLGAILLKKNQLITSYMNSLNIKLELYITLLYMYLIDVAGYYYEKRDTVCDEQAEYYYNEILKLIKYLARYKI